MADEEDEREVLTSLPRSRPTRRSAKRGERSPSEDAQVTPERETPSAVSAEEEPSAVSAAEEPAEHTPARPPRAKPSPDEAKGPRPRVQPERKVPAAGYAAPAGSDQEGSPGATEILTTTIQAATELVQIGFSVGRQALRAALDRLPRP